MASLSSNSKEDESSRDNTRINAVEQLLQESGRTNKMDIGDSKDSRVD
jgi:hypothetical protein